MLPWPHAMPAIPGIPSIPCTGKSTTALTEYAEKVRKATRRSIPQVESPKFPMYVIPLDIVLHMTKVISHQELLLVKIFRPRVQKLVVFVLVYLFFCFKNFSTIAYIFLFWGMGQFFLKHIYTPKNEQDTNQPELYHNIPTTSQILFKKTGLQKESSSKLLSTKAARWKIETFWSSWR